MPIPPYHARLRTSIGHDLIWAPGVAVHIVREALGGGHEVLLQRRSDTGAWNPICGAVDPGEDPDTCAVREAAEEAGIAIEVVALLGVGALSPGTLPNGDVCQYLDHQFLARPLGSGEDAHIADDESLEIRWVDVDDLPPMEHRFVNSLRRALAGDLRTRFGAQERLLGS